MVQGPARRRGVCRGNDGAGRADVGDGTTGDAAGSIAIAAVFGAWARSWDAERTSPWRGGTAPAWQRGREPAARIRLEIRKGVSEVRVVDEEGKLLRTARVGGARLTKRGGPRTSWSSRTRVRATRRGLHGGPRHPGPMTEPGASPLEAAAPLGGKPAPHPVVEAIPFRRRAPLRWRSVSNARAGETVHVGARPMFLRGDYPVLLSDSKKVLVEVPRPATLRQATP